MSRITKTARASVVVGAASVVSRLLGFVRDMMLAHVLGAGIVADAFLVAFRIPNLVRRVLAEGGLNAGFVPLLGAVSAHGGEEKAREFAGRTIISVALFFLALTAVAEVAAGPLVLFVATGFKQEPEKLALAIYYMRLSIPFIAFSCVASLVAAYLNAKRCFLAAALAPVVVNALLVSVLLWASNADEASDKIGVWLAIAISLSGLAQLVIVTWAMLRMPQRPRWRMPRFNRSASRLLGFALPAFVASGMTQAILLVATIIASREPSAVSWLYYADRLFQLPLSFIGVAAGVVLLPEFVSDSHNRDAKAATFFLSSAMGLALPAAAGLIALGTTIVSILFERGAFTPADADATSAFLIALASGLPAAAASKILIQPFFARQQIAPPLVAGTVGAAIAYVTASILLKFSGPTIEIALFASATPIYCSSLGFATSLGLWVQAILLVMIGRGDIHWSWKMVAQLVRLSIAALIMGVAVGILAKFAAPFLAPEQSLMLRGAILATLCLAGIAVYSVFIGLMGDTATIMPWRKKQKK